MAFGTTAGVTLFIVMGDISKKTLLIWGFMACVTLFAGLLKEGISKQRPVGPDERRGQHGSS